MLVAQPNVEDQASRQLESGREFYRAGRYVEAVKDFQTVAEGYATSSVADDALLAIADYQLDLARDPMSARATADTLIKRYATADSAPMGTSSSGARPSRSIRLRRAWTRPWPASIACRGCSRRATPSRRRSITGPKSIGGPAAPATPSTSCGVSRHPIRDRSGPRGPACWSRRCCSPTVSRKRRCAPCSVSSGVTVPAMKLDRAGVEHDPLPAVHPARRRSRRTSPRDARSQAPPAN